MKEREAGHQIRERSKDTPFTYLLPQLNGSIHCFIRIRAIIQKQLHSLCSRGQYPRTSEKFQDSNDNDTFLISCCLPFLVSKAVMLSFLKVFFFSQLILRRQVWTLEFFTSTKLPGGTWASDLLKPSQLRCKVRGVYSGSRIGMLPGKHILGYPVSRYRKQGHE